MAATFERTLRRFVGRVRRRAALAGALEGLAAAALGLLALVLVLRAVGVPLAPGAAPREAALLLGPVLALGLALGILRRLWRSPFDLRLGAQHLDRRLGLGGLLLTARETDASRWRPQLDAALARAAEVSPRLRPRRLLVHGAVVVVAVGVVLLLPVPEPPRAYADPLGARSLEVLEAELARLEEQAVTLEEGSVEVLRERMAGMREGLERDGFVSRTDLDAASRRLDAARLHEAAALARAMERLTELAAAGGGRAGDEASAAEDRQELLDAARAAGLLENLPPEVLERLGMASPSPGGGLQPGDLPADPEALRALAAALAEAVGERLEGLAGAGDLAGVDLESLERRLAEAVGELQELQLCRECQGGDPNCPG